MKTKSGDLCLMHMPAPKINAIFFIAYKSSTEVFVITHVHGQPRQISMWSETTEQFQEYEKYLKKL